jgi:hypothetical protein
LGVNLKNSSRRDSDSRVQKPLTYKSTNGYSTLSLATVTILLPFSTIIATDFLAQIEPLVLPNENSPPSGNVLKINVVHSAPSAPPVDVYVTAPGADINAATPTLSDVAFTEFSPFLEIPEDDYRIRLTEAGFKTPIYDSGTVPLDAESILTVVAVDANGGGLPVGLVVLTNDPATPFIEIPNILYDKCLTQPSKGGPHGVIPPFFSCQDHRKQSGRKVSGITDQSFT